jgi:hypothetical protein
MMAHPQPPVHVLLRRLLGASWLAGPRALDSIETLERGLPMFSRLAPGSS